MDLTTEFPLNDDIIYVNHAAVSPWPVRTVDAVKRFAEENGFQGSLNYPEWLATEKRLKQRIANLIKARSADDIALVKNTSEALSFVAYGLEWTDGDNIVIPAQEFPSNRIVWESLRSSGVEVRLVDLHSDSNKEPEDLLIEAMDNNTRLLSVSAVQYGNGIRMDLKKLGRFCHAKQVFFCVDAIQAIGAMQFDVSVIDADFVMADGHKWMMGPEGLGFFYCRPELRNSLKLTQFGWHMVEHAGDFEQRDWQPTSTGQRFECGSPNMLGIHALDASLALIEEYGIANVESDVLARTRLIRELVEKEVNLELCAPFSAEDERLSGIVTFRHRSVSNTELFATLKERGVFCAMRGGGIRVSPHFYTPENKISDMFSYI